MESLNKYLSATGHHLGVEEERYGGGFRAIVAHRDDAEFLFAMLEGDDFAGTQAQFFLGENPLFPAAHGATPTDALQKLNAKLAILFAFTQNAQGHWVAEPQFSLLAQYDADPGEVPSMYQVQWSDVVQDLQSNPSLHFYEDAKARCSASEKRDLHALVNFKYEGAFAQLCDV